MAERLFLIINIKAGQTHGEEAIDKVVEMFKRSAFDVDVTLGSGDDIVSAARRAISEEASTVVAGGGDGTISSVAALLAGTEIRLGVLPLGTLNHFAKCLGMPLGLPEAAQAILDGDVRSVDMGEVNGRTFINNSSVGLYPRFVRSRVEHETHYGWSRRAAFIFAALAALHFYRLLHVRLMIDGQRSDVRVPFIFIGNNEYVMSGLHIGDRARLDEGCLSIYLTVRCGRLRLLWLMVRALFGGLHQARDFETHLAKDAIIHFRRQRVDVALDGEVTTLDTPLHYRTRPAALKVIVPRAAIGEGAAHA